MVETYLGLGGNLGDVESRFARAVEELSHHGVQVSARSSIYRTEPWGYDDQAWFLNQVVRAETSLDAVEVLETCLQVERSLGRVRGERWGPRTIDIDLLLYSDHVIREAALQVPHPRMEKRGFVLVPLVELAPDLRHPVLERTMAELLELLTDERRVERVREILS